MSTYICNNCQSEISGHGIKCIECPEFDLCLQCFALGAETGGHKRDHPYQITIGPVIGAFDCGVPWTLAEETMLLDAVEQYGFGNWEDVANHVESKSPEQSEYHYNSFYVNGNVGKATFQSDATTKVVDQTCPEGALSPSISSKVIPLDLTIQEQHILGYMPLRDDFEREHDNEAETLVSGMMINYDDDELDIAIKLAHVERYRLRLKERERRKKLARDYGLIVSSAQAAASAAAAAAASSTSTLNSPSSTPNKLASSTPSKLASSTPSKLATSTPSKLAKSSPHPKKKGSKEDREFQEKTKPFAQCHSFSEHQSFSEGCQREKELKSRIKELFKYRRNGITKLEEVEKFEEERSKREKKRDKIKKLGSFSQAKRLSMASKNAADEEKLGILIDESESRDDDEPMDTREMAKCPGYEMLSCRERKLCNSIGMKPASYMTVKTCIVKDYLQRRNGLPVKIRYPSGMDKTHRRRIMSFLADNGWIGMT